MKTHEAARILSDVAKVLKNMPNVELTSLRNAIPHQVPFVELGVVQSSPLEMLDRLQLLLSIPKKDLVNLIRELRLPVMIRPRDSSIDLLKKLSSFLNDNPEHFKELLKSETVVRGGSTALLDALGILLPGFKRKM